MTTDHADEASAAGADPADAMPSDRRRFVIVGASVWLLLISAGGMFLVVVSLKHMAQDFGWPRWIPSFAYSLQFIGSGFGGLLMGWVLDRVGFGVPALIGAVMVSGGAMLVSRIDAAWQLHIIYAVMFGLAGQGSLVAPAMANIARWFTRRRGMAVGIVASGQSLAGVLWPGVFGKVIEEIGWRQMYFWFGVFAICTLLPVAWLLRHKAPPAVAAAPGGHARKAPKRPRRRPALSIAAFQWLLCAAIVGCCVAMALPLAHMVAFATDRGFPVTTGTGLLAAMLLASFLSRSLMVGLLSDTLGGLKALFIFSVVQAGMLAMLTFSRELWMLYASAILFGLGYGGIFPVYAVAIREHLPFAQVGRRTGIVFLFGALAMGLGGWMGGYLFDLTGSYTLPFLIGVGFNVANLIIVALLIMRTDFGEVEQPAAA